MLASAVHPCQAQQASLPDCLQVKDATGVPVPLPSVVPPESVPATAGASPAQSPAAQEGTAYSSEFVNRRWLVFAGIVIG